MLKKIKNKIKEKSVMGKNVLDTDLTGKVCVITGAGGAICGMFAEKLAARWQFST